MTVQYPSHLYIRIDRSLRADLVFAADAAGQTVSAFARRILRGSITQRAGVPPTAQNEAMTFSGTIRQPSNRGER